MGRTFHPYEPDVRLLFPPSPRDWLPDGHLAHFVSDTIDALDLAPFLLKHGQREDGRGQLAFHPAPMLEVLVYAYCVGNFSSRRIAAATLEHVALRYLAAGQQPSHTTIARFRLENLDRFQALFVEVVRIARETGRVSMGTLAVDGSKLKGNASKHKAMSYGRMKSEERRQRKVIRRITDLTRRTDEAEDARFGPDFRGDELPQELRRRKDRSAKIREAKKSLEEAQAEEDRASGRGESGRKLERSNGTLPPTKQSDFTDPESRILKACSGAFEQSYDAQIAVDEAERIIVAAEVSQCASASRELVRMVQAAQANVERKARRVLVDSGYKSEASFVALEEQGIEALVALGRGECPRNQPRGGQPATRRMGRRLASPHGRQRYEQRKILVEPVSAWIQQDLGLRGFPLRGAGRVKAEWALVCLAMNLRRMSTRIEWT